MFTKEFKVLVAFLIVCTLLVVLIATTHNVQLAVERQPVAVEKITVIATPTVSPVVTVTPKASSTLKVASPTAR